MSFLDSYKRLDNLCKDLFQSETGLTTYISSMEQLWNRCHQPIDSDPDYQKLKHYRYIRNQIVHENDADEATMCNEDDTGWIEQFYQRILNQTDPIALYYKAETPARQQAPKPKRPEEPFESPGADNRSTHSGKRGLVIVLFALIVALAVFWLLWYHSQ